MCLKYVGEQNFVPRSLAWGQKYGNNMQTRENMTSKTAYFTPPYLSGFYQYFSFTADITY